MENKQWNREKKRQQQQSQLDSSAEAENLFKSIDMCRWSSFYVHPFVRSFNSLAFICRVGGLFRELLLVFFCNIIRLAVISFNCPVLFRCWLAQILITLQFSNPWFAFALQGLRNWNNPMYIILFHVVHSNVVFLRRLLQ